MSRREDLLERRAEIGSQLDAIEAAANENEGGLMTDEQRASYDGHLAAREQIDAEIEAIDRRREGENRQWRERASAEGSVSATAAPEQPFANLGEQLMAVAMVSDWGTTLGSADARQEAANRLAAVTGHGQSVGSDGGFAVAPTFGSGIWAEAMEESNSLLGLTDQYTVEGESLTLLAHKDASRADGSLFGGVQGYWIAEADQITASKGKLRQVKLEPQELAVLTYVTEKLLRNANVVSIEEIVRRAAAAVINYKVGQAIFAGTGAGKPRGFSAHASTITVAKETGQAADTVVEANIAKMWNRLHPMLRAGAVWLINNDVQPQLDLMDHRITNVAGTENVGGYFSPLYNAQANTLKGRPVIPFDHCETVGDKNDIVLWAGRGYATGIRGGIREAASMHVRFEYAEMAFRFMFEVDGQPWLESAITPAKGSTTTSASVNLAARA